MVELCYQCNCVGPCVGPCGGCGGGGGCGERAS